MFVVPVSVRNDDFLMPVTARGGQSDPPPSPRIATDPSSGGSRTSRANDGETNTIF